MKTLSQHLFSRRSSRNRAAALCSKSLLSTIHESPLEGRDDTPQAEPTEPIVQVAVQDVDVVKSQQEPRQDRKVCMNRSPS